jgi:hypothetical protein
MADKPPRDLDRADRELKLFVEQLQRVVEASNVQVQVKDHGLMMSNAKRGT